MTSEALNSLVKIGSLKVEAGDQTEFDGLKRSGETRLKDAANPQLAPESRFDLAYNAAHALSLAALRWHGYRSEKRFIVFQALEHTLGLPANVWRVLDRCHALRNSAEYEGEVEVDEALLAELLNAASLVRDSVKALAPIDTKKPKGGGGR
jgi:hypothetical protein